MNEFIKMLKEQIEILNDVRRQYVKLELDIDKGIYDEEEISDELDDINAEFGDKLLIAYKTIFKHLLRADTNECE